MMVAVHPGDLQAAQALWAANCVRGVAAREWSGESGGDAGE